MTHTLEDALNHILDKKLGPAVGILRDVVTKQTNSSFIDRLDSIDSDYERMLDFMLRGYKDPQRDALYLDLLRRTYRLIQDMELDWLCKNRGSYADAHYQASGMNMSYDFVRSVLESFVTDVAMLSLDSGEVYHTRKKELYDRHQQFLDKLFCALWLSPQWSESDARFYKELLLSPTINENDALYLTSAVMLSCLTLFDYHKFQLLSDLVVYSSSKSLHQRALVGWAFCLPEREYVLYPSVSQQIQLMTQDDQIRMELIELQKQVFYCLNAEKDNQELQREVIPTLIQNNQLNITRFGITEKEEDALQDILHPEAADEAMEDVEKSIKRMMEMEKAGSDIYFGGFSKMKRFPFFNTLSNWFCPFFSEHPSLNHLHQKTQGNSFVDNILSGGIFCDSDKYSLCFAMVDIIDRLPANIKEMLGSTEMLGPAISDERKNSSAYIRRMYLQDLYRFFKLYPRRQELCDPFTSRHQGHSHAPAFMICSTLLPADLMSDGRLDVALFLYGLHRYTEASMLLTLLEGVDEKNAEFYLLRAMLEIEHEHYEQAKESFRQVLRLSPENKRAMRGLARLCLLTDENEQAEKCYQWLTEHEPNKKSHAVNYAISLLKRGKAQQAVDRMFQLYYDYPDDLQVKRVLAWSLLFHNRLDDALKYYQQLLDSDSQIADDSLNMGYVYWLKGQIKEAVDFFHAYLEQENKTTEASSHHKTITLESKFEEDKVLLDGFGISETDKKIICFLVESNYSSRR